ncbi:MAG: hypothetical protein JJU13_16270 [Balneolaceae bacterium]|nr:hypothetical protein [Balneolaceae bacterium]
MIERINDIRLSDIRFYGKIQSTAHGLVLTPEPALKGRHITAPGAALLRNPGKSVSPKPKTQNPKPPDGFLKNIGLYRRFDN